MGDGTTCAAGRTARSHAQHGNVSGEMRTMPGLGKHPAAERIDIDDEGNVVGPA